MRKSPSVSVGGSKKKKKKKGGGAGMRESLKKQMVNDGSIRRHKKDFIAFTAAFISRKLRRPGKKFPWRGINYFTSKIVVYS